MTAQLFCFNRRTKEFFGRLTVAAQRVLGVSGFLVFLLLAGCATPRSAQQEVWQTEEAFAQTMARRDAKAFARYLSDEAVFMDSSETLRGKSKVLDGWASCFRGAQAPFSWAPDRVEVLESGTLALSTGLVRNPQGSVVGRFNSIWRREGSGLWRIVFDYGSPASDAEKR